MQRTSRKKWIALLLMISIIGLLIFSLPKIQVSAATPKYGLHVDENGTMSLNGKSFQALGVNFYDPFIGLIRGSTTLAEIEAEFKELKRAGIPVVRSEMCGFYPDDALMYFESPDWFLAKMDKVVELAEKYEIGIIADLFWCFHSIPDIALESMKEIANPNSLSVSLSKEYATTIVKRYLKSPAIWGWEIGNEYNLAADLYNVIPPNYNELHFAGVAGGRTPRTADDNMKSSYFQAFNKEIGKAIRVIDPYRFITGGESEPRNAAYNLFHHDSWKMDTPDEMGIMMNMYCPAPLDTMSVHFYQDNEKEEIEDFDTQMKNYMAQAKKYKKSLIVGEFGIWDDRADTLDKAKEILKQQLNAIDKYKVPLSCIWVYGKNDGDQMNIGPTGDNSYQYNAIVNSNKQLRTEGYQDTQSYWKTAVPLVYKKLGNTVVSSTSKSPSVSSQSTVSITSNNDISRDSESSILSTDSISTEESVIENFSSESVGSSLPSSNTPIILMILIPIAVVIAGSTITIFILIKKKIQKNKL